MVKIDQWEGWIDSIMVLSSTSYIRGSDVCLDRQSRQSGLQQDGSAAQEA